MGIFDKHRPRKAEALPSAREPELTFHEEDKDRDKHLSILEECRDIEVSKEMENYRFPVGAERFFMKEPENVFHDTVPLPEEQLSQARDTAAKQNGIVLDFFRKRFAYKFTPAKVHEILEAEGEKILLNSVRRSITNLTKANRLIKCSWDEREMGKFGKENRTWRYRNDFVNPLNKK